jgi:hypothetical protein
MVRWALAGIVASTGCSLITDNFVTNDFSGDPYPVDVETTSGAIVVGLRQGGVSDKIAVLDLLSPVTLVDPGLDVPPTVTETDVVLLGAEGPGGALDRPRARFVNAQLIGLHPCQTPVCIVGPAAVPRPYEAMIGADALAGDAVRLRLGVNQIFVLPDIAGDEIARSRACDAVLPSPFRGGGTLVIGGTELPFGGRRIAIDTCLGPNPDPAIPQSERGADALLVASTGVGITLLGASAYERYRLAHPEAMPADQLPAAIFNLPSGPIAGNLGTVSSLALVGTSAPNPRAPCRQVYASHFLTARDCLDSDTDCPCDPGVACGVPGIVELGTPIDILVISDDEPTLQSLRTELRPDQPEVDGILGTNAMQTAELDVDYSHNRVLGRCTVTTCVARPEMQTTADRPSVRSCLGLP